MRGVARRLAVKVGAAHVERIHPEVGGDLLQDVFDREHALRAAEAAERGLRHGVRLAAVRRDRDILEEVGVVDVEHGAVVDGARQVRGEAAARCERDVEAAQASAVVEPGFVFVLEGVTLACHRHVVVAIDAHLHRAAGAPRQDRRDAREQRGLRFLAAEGSAHAPALDHDVVRVHAQRVRDQELHFARVLRRAVHQHAAILPGHRERHLALEIEVVLPAAAKRAAQPMRRGAYRARRISARHRLAGQDEALGGQRGVDGEDGGKLLVLDTRAQRRLARGLDAGRGDREQRLSHVLHDTVGQDRVVVHHRPAIVDAGYAVRGQHGDHAG